MKKLMSIALCVAILTACTEAATNEPTSSSQIQNMKSAPMNDPAKIRAGELLKKATDLYQKKDYTNALTAFEQADQAGHFKAKRYIGLMYLNGQGVTKNEQAAFNYFKQAAENGDITSQYWLGYCYENGIGTKSDLPQAIQWYKKSAERGDHISRPAIDALKRLNIQ